MTQTETTERGTKPVLRYIIAAVALLFGLVTIKAGGDVLFFNAQAKASAGSRRAAARTRRNFTAEIYPFSTFLAS